MHKYSADGSDDIWCLTSTQSEIWTVEVIFLIGNELQFSVLNGQHFSKKNGELNKQLKLIQVIKTKPSTCWFFKIN